jgi:molybdopterin/thiamine biosynthesis adenylyltransferase
MHSDYQAARVLIAGLGNIGSPLATLLSRLGVGHLRLIDRDRVEAKNVATQEYRPEDVGRFKAEVLAERLTGCAVECLPVDLEDMPLGFADVDLILGALDSRRARQLLISEVAWPLGIPVVDGGVGEGWKGRVQVFVPGEQTACLECTWGGEDYRRLVEEYPCVPGGSVEVPATGAPAFMGASVASVMVAEAAKLLGGEKPEASQEIAFDLLHRRHLVTRLRRNPRCRFGHEVVRTILTLDRPFHDVTAAEMLHALEAHIDGEAMHLECRRGIEPSQGFSPSRMLSWQWLVCQRERKLHELGLAERDRIRVRTNRGSVFVRWQP